MGDIEIHIEIGDNLKTAIKEVLDIIADTADLSPGTELKKAFNIDVVEITKLQLEHEFRSQAL